MKRTILPLKTLNRFVITTALITALILLLFATMQWLDVSMGRFLDWLVGIVTFWWLLLIVIVPWNVYFQAKTILHKAEYPTDKRIIIKPEQVAYAHTWTNRALLLAVGLHILSAIGLYFVARSVSVVGYVGSVIALLLTGLRPIIRGYEYLSIRLSDIDQQAHFPQDNVFRLQDELNDFNKRLASLEANFNTKNADSWVTQQKQFNEKTEKQLDSLKVAMNNLRINNQSEHERLSRDAQSVAAQLSEDGQFLNHVREIIRFVKTA